MFVHYRPIALSSSCLESDCSKQNVNKQFLAESAAYFGHNKVINAGQNQEGLHGPFSAVNYCTYSIWICNQNKLYFGLCLMVMKTFFFNSIIFLVKKNI